MRLEATTFTMLSGSVTASRARLGLLGELRRLAHVVGELARHRIHEGPHARPLAPASCSSTGRVAHGEERVRGLIRVDGHPLPALDEGLEGAVGQAGELHHLGQSAHGVDVVGLGLVGGRRPLRGHDQHASGLLRLLQSAHALVPLHEDGSQHPREEDEVARRQ